MERWNNRVAVVTGASSGIGSAISVALVGKGMIVAALARRQERLDLLKASLPADQQKRFYGIKCDVSVEDDIKKTFEWIDKHLGGVDVLVNNAAIIRKTNIIDENNTDDLKAILDTNVLGVALCTREAFRIMRKHSVDDGHIVMINSTTGHRVPIVPGHSFTMYAPSKHAITALTEVLRQEFLNAGTKTKITSISPGVVDTEGLRSTNLEKIKLPMLRPEDIADAVVYCVQTPPIVQIHEMVIKPLGEFY